MPPIGSYHNPEPFLHPGRLAGIRPIPTVAGLAEVCPISPIRTTSRPACCRTMSVKKLGVPASAVRRFRFEPGVPGGPGVSSGSFPIMRGTTTQRKVAFGPILNLLAQKSASPEPRTAQGHLLFQQLSIASSNFSLLASISRSIASCLSLMLKSSLVMFKAAKTVAA